MTREGTIRQQIKFVTKPDSRNFTPQKKRGLKRSDIIYFARCCIPYYLVDITSWLVSASADYEASLEDATSPMFAIARLANI